MLFVVFDGACLFVFIVVVYRGVLILHVTACPVAVAVKLQILVFRNAAEFPSPLLIEIIGVGLHQAAFGTVLVFDDPIDAFTAAVLAHHTTVLPLVVINATTLPNTLLTSLPKELEYAHKYGDLTAKMSFSGKDIGKSNFWLYFIKYDDKLYNVVCVVKDGKPVVGIYPEDLPPANQDLLNKFIVLTKENDSPVFVKKLMDNSYFLNELKSKNDESLAVVLFSYLFQFELDENFRVNESIPYWSAFMGDDPKISLLLADKNIDKNPVHCVMQNY